MPVLLFAGLDAHRQPVLRRRQRARGVGCECAGWVVGLIEIEHDVAVVRHGRVEKAARAVSLLSARPIAEYIEKFLGVGGFQYWPKPVLVAVQAEDRIPDRKSTRLNSSHLVISYAVFCL